MKFKKCCLLVLTLCILLSGCTAAGTGSAVSATMPPALHKTMLNDLTKLDPDVPMIAWNEVAIQFRIDPPFTIPSEDDREIIEANGWDLLGVDMSDGIQLDAYADKLKYVAFDQYTIWPDELPEGFDPKLAMEYGKNPGLGVRSLHEEGYTGKGVNIAIIDTALMIDHEEYAENIMFYERIECLDPYAAMHGPLVTSIAVGKTIGVAPDAKVYYIAITPGYFTQEGAERDCKPVAQAIRRVLEINKYMPQEEKIRVISISIGFVMEAEGASELYEAIEEAKESGVFVITVSTQINYGFDINGLGRAHLNDPDSLSSYSITSPMKAYYSYISKEERILYVPMDSRAQAYPGITSLYAFSSIGGISRAIPWLAGMYALCLQKNPALDYQTFIDLAFETGDELVYSEDDRIYELNTVINPRRLIESIPSSNP